MNNIVKFIYCLNMGKDDTTSKIGYYAKYTKLIDKRTLKLGFGKSLNFHVSDLNAPHMLLDYLMYKDHYQGIAYQHWKSIQEYCANQGMSVEDRSFWDEK